MFSMIILKFSSSFISKGPWMVKVELKWKSSLCGKAEMENVNQAKKMTFSISIRVTFFNFDSTFPIYGPLVKTNNVQIFYTHSDKKKN